MSADSDTIPVQILEAYGLELQTSARATSGLINQTWVVETKSSERYVIQRLHPLIAQDVNERIRVVTRRLQEKGICTPQMVPTRDGSHYVTLNGVNWRVLTFVSGVSFDRVPDVQHTHQAGIMLARFHSAFIDWDEKEVLPLSSTHGLSRHLNVLRAALDNEAQHNEYASIAKLADEIFTFARSLPEVTASAPRVVHGDPKISNVLFDTTGNAVCMVDLDTVGLMAVEWELGDAFRSWCNPHGEDTENTAFSLELFGHALSGYAVTGRQFINSQETVGTVPAILTIYTELAARFCADALNEDYFSWDPVRFSTHTEHNLMRARGQLNAAKDLASKRSQAEQIMARVFGSKAE